MGSSPNSPVDFTRLKQLQVTSVICLQSDQDLSDRKIDWPTMLVLYRDHALSIYRFPILDFDEIDLGNKVTEPIRKLHALLSDKERVYIHCNAGVCRAPAVVLGYLCHYQGMTIESGLRKIRSARAVASPYRSAVKKALIELSGSDLP